MTGEEAQDHRTVGVAIPAAGLGTRMGGARKPLLNLAGDPLLLHALRPFLAHPQVTAIAVALGVEELQDPPGWLADVGGKVILTRGGASRGDSVWAAIQELPKDVDIIAVHDAARPLVDGPLIDRCLKAVGEHRGVVAGWPAVDTLKEVGEGNRIRTTLPRDKVWHAQTPQVFPREMIVAAYREAVRLGLTDTDDAALVERAGGEVVLVPGSPSNLKVTRPEDLALAEFHLGRGSD